MPGITWDSDEKIWAQWLNSYNTALSAQSELPRKSGLVDLDSFAWSDLPVSLKKQGYITSAEYVRLVKWKLQRGKWRPRLQGYADALDESDIKDASKQAIAQLKEGNIKGALAPLVALRGCGPATASAVLAAADETIPFMSDELLACTHGRDSKKYTVPVFIRMVELAREKAEELTSESNDHQWTARDIERAVFAAEYCEEPVADSNHTAKADHEESKKPASSRTRSKKSKTVQDTEVVPNNSPGATTASPKSRKRTRRNVEVAENDTKDSRKKSKARPATAVEDAEIEEPVDHSEKTSPRASKRGKGKDLTRVQKTPLRRSKRRGGT